MEYSRGIEARVQNFTNWFYKHWNSLNQEKDTRASTINLSRQLHYHIFIRCGDKNRDAIHQHPKGCSRKTYQFREDFHGLVRYFITCDLWDWETNLEMFFRKLQESYSKSRDKEHGISSLWLLHMKGCCPISYSLLKLVASSRVTNNLSFKS